MFIDELVFVFSKEVWESVIGEGMGVGFGDVFECLYLQGCEILGKVFGLFLQVVIMVLRYVGFQWGRFLNFFLGQVGKVSFSKVI